MLANKAPQAAHDEENNPAWTFTSPTSIGCRGITGTPTGGLNVGEGQFEARLVDRENTGREPAEATVLA